MRAQLSAQFNKVLETRDSARGLIVSMSDVLFDTGQYSLNPGAREKLAKVLGILFAIRLSTSQLADTRIMLAATR